MRAARDEVVSLTERDSRMAEESCRRLSPFARRNGLTLLLPKANHEARAIELPRPAVELLMRILTEMAAGNSVTLTPVHTELTTQQAASLLGVSRPFLIKQMKEKKIPFRRVGSHRRVRLQDLMDYKKRIDAGRAKVLEELAAQAQELNLGY